MKLLWSVYRLSQTRRKPDKEEEKEAATGDDRGETALSLGKHEPELAGPAPP